MSESANANPNASGGTNGNETRAASADGENGNETRAASADGDADANGDTDGSGGAPAPSHLLSLVKPRIVALLSLTGACALLAAGGAGPARTAGFVVAGAAVAGGSAALNCWYDRDLDRHMERTADRPLPRGDLSPRVALAFALGLLGVGTAVGLWTLPAVAVGYMWLGVAAYVGLYTVALKRRHPAGVVLGGSAGSFPVLAGWTAVAPLDAAPLALAVLVFVWTPAHAWALAAVYRDDFAAADVPTLPVVADERTVRRAVWWSALLTVGVAAAAVPLAGRAYAVGVAVGSPLFLLAYRDYRRDGSASAAVRAFFTSNCYLAVLFAAWGASGVLGSLSRPALLAAGVLVAVAFFATWSARPRLRGVPAAVRWDVPGLPDRSPPRAEEWE